MEESKKILEEPVKTTEIPGDKPNVGVADGSFETSNDPARTLKCPETAGPFNKDIPDGSNQAQPTSKDPSVVANHNLGNGHQQHLQQLEIHMGSSRCSENIILYERLDLKAPKSKDTLQETLLKDNESNKTDIITPTINIRTQEDLCPKSQASSTNRSNQNHEASSKRPYKSHETSSNRSRCNSNLTQTSSNTKLSLERGDILLNDKTSILCSGCSPPLSRSPVGFSQPNLSWDQTSVKQREQSPRLSVQQHLTRQSADVISGGDGAPSKQVYDGYQYLGHRQEENPEVVTSKRQHYTFPWRYRVLVTQDFASQPPPYSGTSQQKEMSRSNVSRSNRSCKCIKYKRREMRANPPSHVAKTPDLYQNSSPFRIQNKTFSQQNSSPSHTAVFYQNYQLEPLYRSSRPARFVRRFLVRNGELPRKTDGLTANSPHKEPYYFISRDMVGGNKFVNTAAIRRSYLKHLNEQRQNRFVEHGRVQMQNGISSKAGYNQSYLGWGGGLEQNRSGFIQDNQFDSVDQNNPWVPVFDQLNYREKLLVYEAIKRLLNKQ